MVNLFSRWPFLMGRKTKQLSEKMQSKSIQQTSVFAFPMNQIGDMLGGAGNPVKEGYVHNPVVHRCVRLVAQSAAQVKLDLFNQDRELSQHPFLDILNRPNQMSTGSGLLDEIYCHLLLYGNAFLQAVTIDNSWNEIHLLRPDRVEIKTDDQGWPFAYDYRIGSHCRRFIMAEGEFSPLLHLAMFNPLNNIRGLAPLEAARQAIETHNAASRWNKALLENAACPSGALIYAVQNGQMSEEQFQRLKLELEANFQGSKNAGRPLLLEGGLDWKPMALSPKDMDFLACRNAAARDIALAFGVPPMLLGIPGDNTYANYQEANRAFWLQTVAPIVEMVSGSLAHWANSFYQEPLILRQDADSIDALSKDRETLWNRVNNASFLTDSEKREAVGYAPLA